MDVNEDLIGKTITGVIASAPDQQAPCEIWLLQFSDGTHVEFVSPASRRALKRSARRSSSRALGRPGASAQGHLAPGQLTLNVA